MNVEKMKLLREDLNAMISSDHFDYNSLVEISQELDEFILEALKESIFINNVVGYEHKHEFSMLINKIQQFEEVYDFMRITDPIKKEVLELKQGAFYFEDSECYQFWKRNEICENCISIRAYNEEDIFIKMELCNNKTYMITAVPILIQGKKLVVELLKDATDHLSFQEDKPQNIRMILSSIEHMNQDIVRDKLTDLHNMRFINERLPSDLLISSVRNEPLSFIYIDLVSLKTIQNRYGIPVGDLILQEFAEELKSHIHNGRDWVARYDDQEFIMCFSDMDTDHAEEAANRLKSTIIKKPFAVGNDLIYVETNIGVQTVCDSCECITVEDIIRYGEKNRRNFI